MHVHLWACASGWECMDENWVNRYVCNAGQEAEGILVQSVTLTSVALMSISTTSNQPTAFNICLFVKSLKTLPQSRHVGRDWTVLFWVLCSVQQSSKHPLQPSRFTLLPCVCKEPLWYVLPVFIYLTDDVDSQLQHCKGHQTMKGWTVYWWKRRGMSMTVG